MMMNDDEICSVVSNSVRPHRWQSTRLRRPWDSPGKNTGVGFHFFLQCIKVKSEGEALSRALSDPMDCRPPGSSVHGIFQARVLEWVAIAFSEKNTYFCLIYYAKAFDCVHHRKLENSSRDGNIRPPYLPPEKSVCRGRSSS